MVSGMKPCVTISMVKEASGGPFVYWHDPLGNAERAKSLGFPSVEIFPPNADALKPTVFPDIPGELGLQIAAVGSGGGWVRHQWHLTHPSAATRQKARDFITALLDAAARFGAPVIIGSMQGRYGGDVTKQQALDWLGEALLALGEHAKALGTCVYYEPLNRYESNLLNTAVETVAYLESLNPPCVKVLADLFHMHIEEASTAEGMLTYGHWLGHVHLVDNHRQPAGSGQMDFGKIAAALKQTGFNGHLSAEAFPLPDSHSAARMTMDTFRRWFALPHSAG
jgi:sugar phosphate isomerase/epimerase